MIKSFQTGQDKSNGYPARLWVEGEINKTK